MQVPRLVVGLGNPGEEYAHTRHNAGVWFVNELAAAYHVSLARETRFKGWLGRATVAGQDLRLLVPSTYMNNSGQSVGALASFFRIAPKEILVAYDEVAFAPGVVKLKDGGGHNGHNGIKDVTRALANNAGFMRLRIGVGHPGDKRRMTAYLTSNKPQAAERALIDESIDRAVAIVPSILDGRFEEAMTALHSANPAGNSPSDSPSDSPLNSQKKSGS